MRGALTGLPGLTRREAGFLLGVPIAWAVLLLFHPGGEGDQIYFDLNGDGTRMLVVHVGMLIFIPLMAIAVYLLLGGIESTAARVSRIALVAFVVFYVAWEALQGIANGVLVDEVSALPEADRGVGADLIQQFAKSPLARDLGVLGAIGSLAFLIAAIAAGIALRSAGAPRWAPPLFGLAGLLITAHPPPFGPTGLSLFVVAVVLLMRNRPVPEPAGSQPRSPQFLGRRGPFSRPERALLIGVPLAWAVLLLFHPVGEGDDFYPILHDQVAASQVVHVGTMVLIPLMAGVGFLLLRGVEGNWAAISRIALGVFAVIYMAWEVLIGIGTGIVVDKVNQLSAAERAIGASVVERFTDSSLLKALEYVGTGAWIVALAATGIALVRQTGTSRLVPVLLVLSALPTAWHVPPFGQLGLALFIGAVLLILRGQSSARAPTRPGQPDPPVAAPA